jgi:hypothetical protein
VIRTRKRGGDILYAQDYNIDTLLPRFRIVVEHSDPITMRHNDYILLKSIPLGTAMVFTYPIMRLKAHLDITNTHTARIYFTIYLEIIYKYGETEKIDTGYIVRDLGLNPGESISADVYSFDTLSHSSYIADTLELYINPAVRESATGNEVTTVPITLKDIILYIEA